MAAQHVIKVAAEASGKIFVEAKGDPAKVVAFGAAGILVFAGVGIGLGAYEGAKWASGKLFSPAK